MTFASRRRRWTRTSAHKRVWRDEAILRASSELSDSSESPRCISSHQSASFDMAVELAHAPLAIYFLEQVTLKFSVMKKPANVRYVMQVQHRDLAVAWHFARSFDAYRKLRQRLLQKLQHGHFCNANCPWLYGFLKIDFPKKRVFTCSSARMIEQRRQALETFFVALYEFLTDRKNFGCSIVQTKFANELVEFIYGIEWHQQGLANAVKLPQEPPDGTELRLSESFNFKKDAPQKLLLGLDPQLKTGLSGLPMIDHGMVDHAQNDNCTICGSTLRGAAGKDLRLSTALVNEDKRIVNRTESPCNSGRTSVKATPASVHGVHGSTQRSNSRRQRAVAYYLTTLSCGHQFHDECIVPSLNESLKCPTCGCVPTNE